MEIATRTASVALVVFLAVFVEPLRHPAAAQAASGVAILQVDTDRRAGHDRPEHLRPVPRRDQPLGRRRSLRRADPRRRLRGHGLRDVLDGLRTAGRGARRRGAVRAWHEERADHRRPASPRESGKGAFYLEVGPELRRVGLDQDRIGRAAPVACACMAGDGSVLADRPLPGARIGVAGSAVLVRERAHRSRGGRSRSSRPDAAPCSSTSSR